MLDFPKIGVQTTAATARVVEASGRSGVATKRPQRSPKIRPALTLRQTDWKAEFSAKKSSYPVCIAVISGLLAAALRPTGVTAESIIRTAPLVASQYGLRGNLTQHCHEKSGFLRISLPSPSTRIHLAHHFGPLFGWTAYVTRPIPSPRSPSPRTQ